MAFSKLPNADLNLAYSLAIHLPWLSRPLLCPHPIAQSIVSGLHNCQGPHDHVPRGCPSYVAAFPKELQCMSKSSSTMLGIHSDTLTVKAFALAHLQLVPAAQLHNGSAHQILLLSAW